MLAPYVGMSLYTWTSVIAVVLTGFSAGHWWGGRIAGRPISGALAFTGYVMLAAALTTAGAVVLLRGLATPVMAAAVDPVWAIALLTFGVFFLPSLFAGVPAPVLAHVAVNTAGGQSGRALGAIFAAGALGAIGGTLLSGFVFISWLGTARTLVIVTVIYVAAGLAFLALSGGGRRRIAAATLVCLFAFALSVLSATRLSPCQDESQYYCIRVIDVSVRADETVRLIVLDHLSHGTSAKNLPRVMFTEAAAMLDGITRRRMGDRRFSAFFIGGGTYSVPRAWADRDTGPITVAEIDPAVTRAAIEYFWFDPDGIEILHEDARYVLAARSQREFDVIVGDAFGDIAVPVHLVTREFFELVRARLHPGGLFVMNMIDFADRLDALAAVHETLRSVFPSVEIWTEATPPEPGQQRVFILAASDSPSTFDEFVAPAPELKRFAVFDEAFAERVLAARDPVVLTDDFAPIDRLLAQ